MKALLLSPVMVLKKPAFAWDFCQLTGEIFFAWNTVTADTRDERIRFARALCAQPKKDARSSGIAGPKAGEFAGRKSPVPKHQVFESYGNFALIKISRNFAWQPARMMIASRMYSQTNAECSGEREQDNRTGIFLPPFTGEVDPARRRARRRGPPSTRF